MATNRHVIPVPQGDASSNKPPANRHDALTGKEIEVDEDKQDEAVESTPASRPSRHQDANPATETLESELREVQGKLCDAELNVRVLAGKLDAANNSLHTSKHSSWLPQLAARESTETHKIKAELEKTGVLLNEKERELRRCEANLKKCEAMLNEKDRDNRQIEGRAKKGEASVIEKDREIRQLVAKCQKIEISERNAKNGVEQLRRENFELGEQLKGFAEEFRRTQERSIREMTDGRWVPPPDETIRDRLRRLDRDVRDWSKRWVGPPLKLESLPAEVRRDFVENYLCRVVPRLNGRPPLSITAPKPRMEDRMSLLLLMAVLADEIMECFFESPFFYFDEDNRQVLEKTYKELNQANPRESHIWRSAMVRIMNAPPRRDQSLREAEVLKLSNHRVRNLCDLTSARFTRGHSELLLRSLAGQPEAEAERAKMLSNVMMSAAGIATSLWAQRPRIHWHRIEQLELVPFDVKSTIMEPHPMHRIDEDDTSHNGRKIGIVIRPSLLAPSEDDLDSEDQSKSRVLAKAVVWLED